MTHQELIAALELHSIPEPMSGCHLWLGSVSGGMGYGTMRVDGKNQRAHRLAWSALNGTIPPKMLICHRCDNPHCINPDHLFLGTYKDNNSDRRSKRRDHWFVRPELAAEQLGKARKVAAKNAARGERVSTAKLTSFQVREIKEAVLNGEKQRAVAARFNISQTVVCHIATKKRWRHVQD